MWNTGYLLKNFELRTFYEDLQKLFSILVNQEI